MSKKIYSSIDSIIDSKNLLDNIKEIVNTGTKNNATVVSRYSLVKKYIKTNYPDKFTIEIIDSIKPDINISDEVFKKATDARINKKSFTFTDSDIEKLYSLVLSNNIYDIIIYCLFVSGRRIGEILNGVYTTIKRKPNYTHFMGMSKLKNKEDTGHNILLLDRCTNFKKLIKIIQDKYKGKSIQDITKRTNTRLKKLFGPSYHNHILRAIYGVYSHHKVDNQKTNINGWLTKILNHYDSNSSLNYSYIIYDNKKKDNKEKNEYETI